MKVADSHLLGIREAASVAGRNPETVRRWIWSGRLPARKLGSRLMVDRADLDAVIDRAAEGRAGTLAEWLAEVEDLQRRSGPRRASAADLVFDDRARRSRAVRDARR